MRIFGWVVFAIGLILVVLLLPLMGDELVSTGYNIYTISRVPYWVMLFPLLCIIFGLWLGIRKTKTKNLVCPNRCNITQSGDKFCGACGARLVWK